MKKVRELAVDILDSFEALLEEKDIVMNMVRSKRLETLKDEEASRLYGEEYYSLEDDIVEIIERFLKAKAWNDTRLDYIRSCVKLLLSDEGAEVSTEDIEKYTKVVYDVYLHHIENHMMEFTIEDIAEMITYQDLNVLENMEKEKLLNLDFDVELLLPKTVKDEFKNLMGKLNNATKEETGDLLSSLAEDEEKDIIEGLKDLVDTFECDKSKELVRDLISRFEKSKENKEDE